ncbi:hypothetical protein DPMN_020458 [Dreissena polymorpha]|uniref:Uncharacterized protein n=1 Tax=Dreissena polymorpha TaxID=45954 RepID=A0A9D4NGV4_DREPO|nr:hypothetical protein DPMN_020458 [Dreissena polymorpha]
MGPRCYRRKPVLGVPVHHFRLRDKTRRLRDFQCWRCEGHYVLQCLLRSVVNAMVDGQSIRFRVSEDIQSIVYV